MEKPRILEASEFQNLLLTLTVGTKHFVATQLKEPAKYEGDTASYIVSILIPGAINLNADIVKYVSTISSNVQINTLKEFTNHVQLVFIVLVNPGVAPDIENPTEQDGMSRPLPQMEAIDGDGGGNGEAPTPEAKKTSRKKTK